MKKLMFKCFKNILLLVAFWVPQNIYAQKVDTHLDQFVYAKKTSNIDSAYDILSDLYKNKSFADQAHIQVDLLNHLGIVLIQKDSFSEALKHLQKGEDLCRTSKLLDTKYAMENSRIMVSCFSALNKKQEGKEKIIQNIERYDVLNIPSDNIYRLFNLADSYQAVDQHGKSIMYYFKMAANNEDSTAHLVEKANFQISKFYYSLDQFDRALKHLTDIDSTYLNFPIDQLVLAFRSNLYVENSDINSYETYFLEKLNSKNIYQKALSSLALSEFYFFKKDQNKGKDYLEKGKAHLKLLNRHKSLKELRAYLLFIEAKHYEQEKKYPSALNLLDSLSNAYPETEWMHLNARNFLLFKSAVLKNLGQYNNAHHTLFAYDSISEEQSFSIQQEIPRHESELALAQLANEKEEKENVLVLLEEDKNFKKWIILFSVIGVLSLLSYLYFLIKNSRNAKLVRSQTKNLNALNKEIALEEKEILAKELDAKKRRLTAYTLEMVRKNEYLESLKEDITLLDDKNQADQNVGISKLQRRIELDGQFEKDWEIFRTRFEAMHPNFFSNLLSKYPNLSNSELRLCAFLILDYKSSEIANLLNLSKGSINTFRHRIRKKLALSENEDLNEFLKHLNQQQT